MKSIFIFRRDYRLTDNTAFIECYKKSDNILPIFIFTSEQTKHNEYFSSNSFQFLLESLDSLDNILKDKSKEIYELMDKRIKDWKATGSTYANGEKYEVKNIGGVEKYFKNGEEVPYSDVQKALQTEIENLRHLCGPNTARTSLP
jgi:deoxyribodipyrimidine photolyase